MKIIHDILLVGKDAGTKTLSFVKKNPLYLLLPFAMLFAFIGLTMVISLLLGGTRLSIVGGYMISFLRAGLVAGFAYILFMAAHYKRFSFRYFTEGLRVYFLPYLIMFFLFNFALYLLTMVIGVIGIGLGNLLILLVMLFANHFLESIYFEQGDLSAAMSKGVDFIKVNFFQWNTYTIVFYLIYVLLQSVPLIGFYLGAPYLGLVFLFRAFLYKELKSSSMRKRSFKRNLYS